MKAQSIWTGRVARLCVATGLVIGTSLSAQAGDGAKGPNATAAASPLSLTTLKTFGPSSSTQVTISNHGNVIQFESPIGFEHIANGGIQEGYVLCNGGTNRFDLGSAEAGFAAPSVASCPTGTTCTVTRNTSDGLMQLKQEFTFVGAEKRLRIKHTVKNLSGGPLFSVVLRRQADFDIEQNVTGTFVNNHAATEREAVFAWNDAADSGSVSHGMILRNTAPTATHQAKVNNFESSCSPADSAEAAPVNGDFTDTLEFNLGTINSLASKSVTVDYERHL